MGRYSSKKRKGTRKQSFKNRKKVKKGGGDGDGKEEAATETVDNTNQDAATTEATTTDNTDQNAVAPTTTDNTDQNVAAADAQADANVNTTGTETEQTDTTDANEAGQTDTNANEAQTDTTDANEAGQTDTNANEAGQTDTNANEAGNEDANAEKVLEDQPLTTEDQEALKQADDLDPKEMDALAKQLADDPNANIPLWAKAAIKSGAVGKAVDFLNKHPDLKKAIEKRAISAIQNSGSGSTSAPGAPNAGTGAPGANTGAAAPGGSYTADDAGYQKFLKDVQANPGETLQKVVYVNDGMPPGQIFLKQNGTWTVPE